jgi:phospholipid/cholesterol/gamma-HCH transport system substrate-binding protein
MLTRFVRIQLFIFSVVSIVGVLVMALVYIQVPTYLGIGRITVTLELPGTGGLYRFALVSYRGVHVGKVTAVAATAEGAKATLSLQSSPKIPADLQAQVRSVSAVGEQYVDLRPRTDAPPYLHDGSVIARRDSTMPQQVGPMLDQVSALINSIPKDKLAALLSESAQGLNGAGYDLGSLFDSSSRITRDLNGVADRASILFDDAAPVLDSQAETTDAIRTWTRSLAGVTGQVAADDSQLRTILREGPGAAQEAARLLEQVRPTLPVLLANLTTIGQIAVTYHPSLEQLLVLLPPYIRFIQSSSPWNNATGMPIGDFRIALNDPPPCTVGFLPPSAWRAPADTTEVDTPEGLYCKLPQDSPISVRGARNFPCMGHPGKRAPSVEICDSDRPYEPLAMRQHVLGPYPLDPNLLAQGIPPDDRITSGDHLYAPIEGTPPPPGLPPWPPQPARTAENPPPQPDTNPPPLNGSGGATPPAEPSAFDTTQLRTRPSVALTYYDPGTGKYVAPDGQVYVQSDLVTRDGPRTWKDLVFGQG